MTRRRRVRRRHAVALLLALSLLVFGAIWQNVLGVGDDVTGTLHNFARRVALCWRSGFPITPVNDQVQRWILDSPTTQPGKWH